MDRPKETPSPSDNPFAQRLLAALQEARTKIESFERVRSEPIAIVGMGCRFPGDVSDTDGFWRVLCQETDVISEVPKDRWDIDAFYDPDPDAPGKMYTRYGGFLSNVSRFDARFFGISGREAIGMDPQQRLLLEVSWEAIENAGIAASGLRGTPTGVFMGIGTFDYAALRYVQGDYEGIDPYFATGGVLSVAAGRLSYALGVTGPSMAVDTACSSSLVAVHLACQSLRSRECDLALAGGVNVILLPELSINFSRAAMLSPDGRCKTFDASADGYVRGEGCGVIVLKRLSDALSARDRILALVRGSAVNQDGPSGGLTVPSGPSQEAVIRRALANAGVRAGEVSYIEAHGTGTSLGDPIEVGALGQVFGGRPETDPLIIGSVKTHIGHLEAAAGIAGVMKVVLALQRAQIPSHLHFKKPNPNIAWEKLPFKIPVRPERWPEGKKRLAGVSAFGASGTNAHVVLEEGPVFETRSTDNEPPYYLLALSARDEGALRTLAGRYAAHIGDHPEEAIGDVCHTAHIGRSHFEERLAVIGATGEEIAAGCRAYGEGNDLAGIGKQKPEGPGKIAFLFSDWGSEYAGMGRDLYETVPEFRAVLDRCDAVLRGVPYPSLIEMIRSGGEPVDAAHALAALFALQVGLFEVWKDWGIEPSLVMGLGGGEYAAACAAGGIGIEEGVRLAAERGRQIEEAGMPPGVSLSSFRTVPFEQLRIAMVSIRTGKPAGEEMTDPDFWGRHDGDPPKLAAGMERLRRQGCAIFVELGPGSSLLEAGRACFPDGYGIWLPSLQTNRNGWRRMIETLGALYTAGITPDWRGVDRGRERNRVALPSYPFQRQRYWIEDSGRRRTGSRRISERTEHPLLGQRLPTAHRDILFESKISPDSPSFLSDHRIYGQVVFPATGYVEMALAGGGELLGSSVLTIEGFSILRPLILTGAESLAVQTIFHPEADGGYTFEIFSETSPGQWRLHATGTICGGGKESIRTERLEALKARCAMPLPVEAHYQRFAEKGMVYGPAFRGIEALRGAEGESLGYVRAAGTVEVQMSACHIHPGFFDACLQTAAALLPAGSGEENQLPVGFKRLRISSGNCPPVLWSHARLHASGQAGESHEFNFHLYDETGLVRIQVEGFSVKSATREALLEGADGKPVPALYTVSWEPVPLPDETGALSGRWIIFADDAGLGEKTAEALREKGAETTLVYHGETYRREGGERYRVNPLVPEDFRRLLADALQGRDCRGMLHLWSLDSGKETNSESIEKGKILGCGSVMHLLQALSRVAVSPRVWLVTQGAQAAGESAQPVSVHQSSLWGFQRVVALEHPEFCSVCIDIDSAEDIGERYRLPAELCHSEVPDGEDWIAYRGGLRYVARLVRAEQRETVPAAKAPRRMRIREYGIIENLTLGPMERRKPGRGEVEISVEATGLNLRDVLRALGMLKAHEPQLQNAADARFGFECAGKITTLGEGVKGLNIGDEVIAGLTVEGSLGTHVTVDAAGVVKKPGWMSPEEGATIPLAFLTAFYGLERLARIQKGERVLIHAAAGGVGLAAIQIAKRAGAVIYATASPGKWAYLKTLGVEAVMNSRTLEYAEEIGKLTGGRGVDVVLNSLTGEYIQKNLEILAPGGRFIEIGKIGIWDEARVRRQRPDIHYHPFDLGEVARETPGLLSEMLSALMAGFERRELIPLKQTVFGLDESAKAFRFMAQARHIGKIVITTGGIRIRPDATYLITGGLGALGIETARWLAEKGAVNLALAGRSEATVTAREQIEKLEQKGVRIAVLKADIAQPAEVSRMLAELSGMPPLKGVIHAAGVLADGVLMGQDMVQFQRVMSPKVEGAWNLHAATRDRKLDFFICYSSAAALLGSAGQANYAAANAFLDGLVQERRREGEHGLSVNWGPWELGMAAQMAHRDAVRVTSRGVAPISPARGVAALERLLARDETQALVLPIDWETYLRHYYRGKIPSFFKRVRGTDSGTRGETPEKSEMLRRLEARLPGQRRPLLLDYVQRLVAEVLGETASEAIKPRQRLFDLGLDSLMAVDMKNRLQSGLGISLGATLVFDYPTVEALVDHLLEELVFPKEAALPSGQRTTGDSGDTGPSPADNLESASEDEIARMLAAELEAGKGM